MSLDEEKQKSIIGSGELKSWQSSDGVVLNVESYSLILDEAWFNLKATVGH